MLAGGFADGTVKLWNPAKAFQTRFQDSGVLYAKQVLQSRAVEQQFQRVVTILANSPESVHLPVRLIARFWRIHESVSPSCQTDLVELSVKKRRLYRLVKYEN